jgi:hypothetical protein
VLRPADAVLGVLALATAACAARPAQPPSARAGAPAEDPRVVTAELGTVVSEALDWLAAADPRLAAREGAVASEERLQSMGTEAVLAEDATAVIRERALDLFAFGARKRALEHAAARVAAFGDGARAPETGPPDGPLARPRLERELLARLIDEELARTADEAALGDASGELVRAIVATWTPPAVPQDTPDRDAWVSKHLHEIHESLPGRPLTGPLDLDVALYPLERLLTPLEFPHGAAAIAQLRVGLDQDMRVPPALVTPGRLARGVRVHLGLDVDPGGLRERLTKTEALLRERAQKLLDASGDARGAIEARARDLLLVEGPCPRVPGSRVRSMAPPPERAALCGALSALATEPQPAGALVALHDDLLFALAAVDPSPPPRTGMLSHPDDTTVDSLRRAARERPLPVLGVALAAELLYPGNAPAADSEARLRTWVALGEAPLDVVERELAQGANRR